jgi:Dolichyl-phosphate-mannose-protein mannosyltransferase
MSVSHQKRGHRPATIVLFSFIVVACLTHLDTTPPLFWDEGWTLAVARNLVEEGHYGQLLDRQPTPPGLAARFTVVLPMALSFRLFGIGVWQGRLPAVCFTVGALYFLYLLTGRIFGRREAFAAVAVAVLLTTEPYQPLLVGRQALAEYAMLCFLLAGYLAFLSGAQGKSWHVAIAALLWALALVTKLQLLPFWLASLAAVAVYAAWRRERRLALISLSAILCSLGLAQVLTFFSTSEAPVPGLYGVSAFVPLVEAARIRALVTAALGGLPTIAGLLYAGWHWRTIVLGSSSATTEVRALRLALFVFLASWLAWFLAFSIGWERYLLPANFVGSVFMAAAIASLGALTWEPERSSARRHASIRPVIAAGIAAGLVPFSLPSILQTAPTGAAAASVARYVATVAPRDALIETYESELIFLLGRRRVHYPPNDLHVLLNRRTFLAEPVTISYDPTRTHDIDYLVVGYYGRLWRLYSEVLKRQEFVEIFRDGPYVVYKHVR